LAFVSDLRILSDAAVLYMFETGEYLEDSAPGTIPSGWAPSIDERK